MPRYRITNRALHDAREVEAPYATTACELCGWMIGDCHVKLLRDGPFSEAQLRDDARPVGTARKRRFGDYYGG